MKANLTRLLAIALALCLLVPVIPVKAALAPKLNASAKTMVITQTSSKSYTLTISNMPAKGTAVWTSSNTAAATISKSKTDAKKAVVTAKKAGTTTITCTIKEGTKTVKTLTCKLTVSVPAMGVRISNATIDTAKYNGQVIPLNGKYDFNRSLTGLPTKWASSDKSYWFTENPEIATVNSAGIVSPVKAGTTNLIICAGKNKTEAMDNYKNGTKYDKLGIKIEAPTLTYTWKLVGSKQLDLYFSEEISTPTVLASENLLGNNLTLSPRTINSEVSSDLGAINAYFSPDKKTLSIKTEKPFLGTYELRLTSGILSSSGIPMTPSTVNLVLSDSKKPTYAGTTLDDSGMIAQIKFSEAIDISQLIPKNPRMNNSTIYDYALTDKNSYKLSADQQVLSIDLSSLSSYGETNATYAVDLYGIKDLAGNPSEPYPVTVTLYVDTTPKPQAVCQNLYRNGNSVIAVFNKSIQIPGYAIIQGTYVYGTVNSDNRKEVIYSLSDTGLTSLTGTNKVTLTGYSSFNAIQSNKQPEHSRSINFSVSLNGPKVTERKLSTVSSNGLPQTVLTLTYDRDVSVLLSTGQLTVSSNVEDIIGAAGQYSYTASSDKKVVTITFTSGTFLDAGLYTVAIPSGFVKDSYENVNSTASIQVPKTAGSSNVMPGPSSIVVDAADLSIIYITFANAVDITSAQSKSNYSISGLTISDITVIANTPGSPAVVQIVLSGNSTVLEDIPYPVRISGIKGYKNTYTTMKPYSEMVNLSHSRTMNLVSVTASDEEDKIVMLLDNAVAGSSTINYSFTQNNRIIYANNTSIMGSTITFTFDKGTLTKGAMITMSPNGNNNIMDINSNRYLNLSRSITVQ